MSNESTTASQESPAGDVHRLRDILVEEVSLRDCRIGHRRATKMRLACLLRRLRGCLRLGGRPAQGEEADLPPWRARARLRALRGVTRAWNDVAVVAISDNYFCRSCCLTCRCYHVASPDLLPGSGLLTAIDDASARRSNALVQRAHRARRIGRVERVGHGLHRSARSMTRAPRLGRACPPLGRYVRNPDTTASASKRGSQSSRSSHAQLGRCSLSAYRTVSPSMETSFAARCAKAIDDIELLPRAALRQLAHIELPARAASSCRRRRYRLWAVAAASASRTSTS